MKSSRFVHVGVCALLSLGVSAAGCGSDASPSADPGTGGAAGTPGAGGGAGVGGGGAPSGGRSGGTSAGGTAPAGMLGAADAKITGSVTQCAGTTAKPLPSDIKVPTCTLPNCQQGACITREQVSQFAPKITDETLKLEGSCGTPNTFCTPVDYIATTGDFLTKKCTSLEGLEGRCISTCIPQISDQLSYLPQADCAANERCAPCFDPRLPEGQDDTKACRVGCDPGPNPASPKTKFPACGAGKGECVPKALVPAEYLDVLPVADCTQADKLCAPTEKAKDLKYQFPKCVPSSGALTGTPDGPGGQRGACVPKYLVDGQTPKVPDGIVMQDTCAAGELCAPCFNPISTPPNKWTGACPK